jgi:hypothetical protein
MNEAMQPWLRRWAAGRRGHNEPRLLDQAGLPWFEALNRGLTDRLDDAGFQARLRDAREQLAALAAETVGRALIEMPAVAAWPETQELLRRAGREPVRDGMMLQYPPAQLRAQPAA